MLERVAPITPQVATGDLDGALPEIDVEGLLGGVVNHPEIQQEVRDRAVPMP
jgi:hypothetical protein